MQASVHDSGSAAAASHAKFKSDINTISNLAQSKVEVDKKIADFRKKDDDTACSVPSGPEEDISDQDDDMQFSSFMPVVAGGYSKKQPRATEAPKRRRTLSPVDSLGPGGLAEVSLPSDVGLDALIGAPTPVNMADVKGQPKGNKQAEKNAKVVTMFEKKQSDFDDSNLLQGKLRARSFTQLAKQLEEGARKIMAEPEYTDVSKKMLEFADQAKAKWELMQKLTKADVKSATIVTADELNLACTLRSSIVAKLILASASTLLKEIEDAGLGGSGFFRYL